jgi:hypothetical protein
LRRERAFDSPLVELVASGGEEEGADEGDAEIEGGEEDVFEEGGAALDELVVLVGFGLFGGDDGGDVFEEIDAAFFASTAVALFVGARGTLITQR